MEIDDVARGLVESSSIGIRTCSGTWRSQDPTRSSRTGRGSRRRRVEARSAVDDDIPVTLPAPARAAKVQRRAAGWGVQWPSAGSAIASLREESEQLADAPDDERAIGAVLFAAVAAARSLGVDAESALRRTTRGFAERYEVYLTDARERGVDRRRSARKSPRALPRRATAERHSRVKTTSCHTARTRESCTRRNPAARSSGRRRGGRGRTRGSLGTSSRGNGTTGWRSRPRSG